MTVTNVIELDGTPFQANDIWYTPPMRESSFVKSVAIKMNDDGSADVKYVLDTGEYEYKTDRAFAEAIWSDLAEGNSPGQIYGNVRSYVRAYPWIAPEPPKPAETDWTIVVTGPHSKVEMLIHHLESTGFTVE